MPMGVGLQNRHGHSDREFKAISWISRRFSTWTVDAKSVIFRCLQDMWQCETSSCFPTVKSPFTGVNAGLRRWKDHLSEWTRSLEANVVMILYRRRASAPRRGLGFDDFKPWIQSGIFKGICWLNGSFLRDDGWCFLKVGVYLLALVSHLNFTAVFVFMPILHNFRWVKIYAVWKGVRHSGLIQWHREVSTSFWKFPRCLSVVQGLFMLLDSISW